jgi:hypothetical protein
MRDCQTVALDALHACQSVAGSDPTKMDACWQQIHTQLAACIPSDPAALQQQQQQQQQQTSSAPVISGSTLIFNENVLIGDKLDGAIENYMACMDSDDKSNDRQSCVEQLFADIQTAVDKSKLTIEQHAGLTEAQNDLTDCLQQSSSIMSDFACLRSFYVTVVDTLKIPLLPLDKKAKRIYATNKAIATNCYHQATSTLRSCLDSIKTIADPTQRETARNLCLQEYKQLLNSCLCLAYGPSSERCPK